MEKTFYLRLPGDSFYDNPFGKDSVCFLFDLENKTISLEKRSLKGSEFVSKNKLFSISKEDLATLENELKGVHEFLVKYMAHYEPADGQRFIHSVFSYGEKKIVFPDYLSNFGNNDIFKRYRYYPEADRVKFYSILRSLVYYAYKTTSVYHKDYPTSNKVHYAVKTHGEKLTLE